MKHKVTIKTDRIIFFVLMIFVLFYRMKGDFPFQVDWYREKLISIPLIIISIMIHKIIQNLTAHQLGDMELKINSQKIWNPLYMIDWIGFLPFVVYYFGWANPTNSLKAISGNRWWNRVRIIMSGILANLLIAIVFRWLHYSAEILSLTLSAYMNVFATINMNYFLFSLLPFPPLDGWLLYKALKKSKVKIIMDEKYGYSLILVLFLINFPNSVLLPVSKFLLSWI